MILMQYHAHAIAQIEFCKLYLLRHSGQCACQQQKANVDFLHLILLRIKIKI